MSNELKVRIKRILVESLMLQISPEEIQDNTALFDAEGLKLDSIDALELTVAIEKNFGVVTPNAQVAREAFVSVNTIANYVLNNTPSCS
jgi:acyl carrier protein